MNTLRYADLLRTVGAELDAEAAHGIVLSDEGEYLMVSWAPFEHPAQARSYRKSGILHLSDLALRKRSNPDRRPFPGYAELLRTLGQILDESDVRLFGLTETTDGFWVDALLGGHDVRRWYSRAELEQASRDRQFPRLDSSQ